MKPTILFRTMMFALLLAAGGLFVACDKTEDVVTEEPSATPAPITSSDVDIQGTWECIYPEETDTVSYLRVTFYEHYYSTENYGPYYNEQFWSDLQWPQGSYFTGFMRANYLIHSGKFYLWNVEIEQTWVEIPFYANIPPTFDVSLHGDTLELECLFTHENYPDLDLPEETHYTFVKLNR